MPPSATSSNESASTWVFELHRARSLTLLSAASHGLLALALIVRWGGAYAATVWIVAALSLAFAYSYRRLLSPGQGVMPRVITIAADGEWRLDGESGYLVSAWVSPWVCRVVISRTRGGRRRLWLARDAMGEVNHWRLRRWLRRWEAQSQM
jgi:hypothetical protein